MEPTAPTHDEVRRVPKVLLHDHLDGGLRPATVLEISAEIGHELPADTPEALAAWFVESADSGSLVRYLETFVHTVAVMQRRQDLARVARECVEDLAADGVVYAEVRYAPELMTAGGLGLDEVVAAVQFGIEQGVRAAGGSDRIVVRQILCAMRQNDRAQEVAELAVAWRDRGVVGFDAAGPEKGFPPSNFADTYAYLRGAGEHITLHAGEADGIASIEDALRVGAERLGHGVRIIDDVSIGPDGLADLGPVAMDVRNRRIPLELCPTSNLQTGVAPTIAEHPFAELDRFGFAVTVNTDNRLMSGTSATEEMWRLVQAFGYGLADLERFTVTAMEAAFVDESERRRLVDEVIRPGYQAVIAG